MHISIVLVVGLNSMLANMNVVFCMGHQKKHGIRQTRGSLQKQSCHLHAYYVIYNSCVLPTMSLRRVVQTLRPQRLTCKVVNITYKDKMTKMWVRQSTQIIDIICHVRNMKWS